MQIEADISYELFVDNSHEMPDLTLSEDQNISECCLLQLGLVH